MRWNWKLVVAIVGLLLAFYATYAAMSVRNIAAGYQPTTMQQIEGK